MKLTAELLQQIEQILPITMQISPTARSLGISRRTLHRWKKRGLIERKRRLAGEAPNPKEEPFVSLVSVLLKGIARGEVENLATISLASQKHFFAACWLLERIFPHKYSKDRGELKLLRQQIAELEKRFLTQQGPSAAA